MTKVNVPGVGIVEFPSDMGDADIEEAIRTKILPTYAPNAITKFGREAASLADTIIDSVTGFAGELAYPVVRAMPGVTAEQARSLTTAPQQLIGRGTGVADTPQYQREASRVGTQALGQALQENVMAPLARVSGIPESDVQNMLSTLGLGLGTAAAPTLRRIGREQVAPRVMAAEEAILAAPGKTARAVAQPFKSAGQGLAAGMRGGEPRFSQPISEELINFGRSVGELSAVDEFLLRSGAGKNEAGRAPVQGQSTASMFENIMREAMGYDPRTTLGVQGALDVAGLLGLGLPLQGTLGRGALQGVKSGLSPKVSNIDQATILKSRGQGIGEKKGEPRTRSVDDLLNELDKMRGNPRPTPPGAGAVPPTASTATQSQANPRPVPPTATQSQSLDDLLNEINEIKKQRDSQPVSPTASTATQSQTNPRPVAPGAARGNVMSMMVDDSQPSRNHGSKQQPLTSQQAEQYKLVYTLSEDPYNIISRGEDGLLRRDFRQDDGVTGHIIETADGGRVSNITYPDGYREKQVMRPDKSKTVYGVKELDDTPEGKEYTIIEKNPDNSVKSTYEQYTGLDNKVHVTYWDGPLISGADKDSWINGKSRYGDPYPSQFGDWRQPIWDASE